MFAIDLAWSPGTDLNGPILTALQEQVGLTLEATAGPVDVVVIDRADKPTPTSRPCSLRRRSEGERRAYRQCREATVDIPQSSVRDHALRDRVRSPRAGSIAATDPASRWPRSSAIQPRATGTCWGRPGRVRSGHKTRPLRNLIRAAYDVKAFQVVGGPSWIDTEHYDITRSHTLRRPSRNGTSGPKMGSGARCGAHSGHSR